MIRSLQVTRLREENRRLKVLLVETHTVRTTALDYIEARDLGLHDPRSNNAFGNNGGGFGGLAEETAQLPTPVKVVGAECLCRADTCTNKHECGHSASTAVGNSSATHRFSPA